MLFRSMMYRIGKEGVREDYAEALKWYREAAVAGNAEAQFALGDMYRQGQGVDKDMAMAKKWLMRAAEQGNGEAESAVWQLFDAREFTPEEAFEWNTKLAGKSNARAQRTLANMYATGKGVRQDYKAAALWYRRAADQGDIEAQFNLALLYKLGSGVQQDYGEAYKWFWLCSLGTPTQGTADLDVVTQAKAELKRINTLVSPVQVSEAKKHAREWKPVKVPPLAEIGRAHV